MRRAESPALLRLGATLERHFGLLSRGPDDRAVATAVDTVAARHGLSADAVAEKASQSVPLLREVAGQLGVGEAFFFRHAEVLDAATDFIVRRAQQQPEVRVWSAGCCRGEEPYSLAIALRERFGADWASRVALAACDVSADSLETARLGEYTEWSFRGAVSDVRRAAAFEPAGRGRWRLKTELRAVRFEHLAVQELVARLAPGEVDAFLFRNVAVYFAPAAVQPLFEAMARALAPGGMLCLAPTDPQPETTLLARDPQHPSIYWKGAAPPRAVAPDEPRGAPPWVVGPVSEYDRGDEAVRSKAPAPREEVERAAAREDGEPLSEARRLADAGQLDEALALLSRPGADERALPHLVLRGQLCLSRGRLKDARHDFRRALYLAPGHLWARYWLTLTQLRDGQADAARVQLRELERQLAGRPGSEALTDGPGTVDELRGAVAELRGRLT